MSGIIDEIRAAAGGGAENLSLIREKGGVHVYRCVYEGQSAVVKYFENGGDRREIGNYRTLCEIDIPTMKVLSVGEKHIVMEDIDTSDTWRLGAEEDMKNPHVLRALAGWYFLLHEGGKGHKRLREMWSENDGLDAAAIEIIREKLAGTEELCGFVSAHMGAIRRMLAERENTVTYNDFYYTNLLVSRDGSAAMMFDYNLTGRGYRYADFRNIRSSVSEEAFSAFEEAYAALYLEKYGQAFVQDGTERRLDDFLSPLMGLVSALRREKFPAWAEPMREDALSGRLLALGREIVGCAEAQAGRERRA